MERFRNTILYTFLYTFSTKAEFPRGKVLELYIILYIQRIIIWYKLDIFNTILEAKIKYKHLIVCFYYNYSMSKRKGDQRERNVRGYLEDAGWAVENPNWLRYGNKDYYNMFDFMAHHPDEKPIFGQVKSETASGINSVAEISSKLFNFEHMRIFYFVYHKRQGYRVVEIYNDETTEVVVDERDHTENMGEIVTKYFEPSTSVDANSLYQEYKSD